MSTASPQTHSKLPPSSSARWSVCTASIAFIEENQALLPKQDWTLADEGTRAHDAAGHILRADGVKPIYDNKEMEGHVAAYVDFCRSWSQPGDRILVECRVPLFYLPSQTGTCDYAIIRKPGIWVFDLKYGVGVSVTAFENKQLAIYAESLIQQQEDLQGEFHETFPVTLAIFQPRDRNDPNPSRFWATTRGELRKFCGDIELAAKGIQYIPHAVKFVAGVHCDKSFCPARGLCKAYGTQGLIALDDDAPVDTIIATKLDVLPALPSITREQRQRIIAAKPAMVAWLEQIENQEVAELLAGAAPQAFKLVEGKSNRKWSDEDKATKLLLDHLKHEEIYPPIPAEILSPKQAEDLLKARKVKLSLAEVITKPPGKPTLVPVGDKRQALTFNPTAGLSVISDDPREDI